MGRAIKEMMLSVSLWVLVLGSVQGDINFSVTSQSRNASYCVLDKEPEVTLTCTITPSATTAVTLIKDSTTYSACDNTQDDCFPSTSPTVPRYSFSSDYTKSEYTFHIANVAIGIDEGTYTCAEGGNTNSLEVAVCDPLENVTITETGTEPITVSGTTDCVFPDADVTVEWFYVPTSSSDEYTLNVTTTSSNAACSNGAKHVISSFEHTDVVENKLEVFFRCKITHPTVAKPVVQDTTRKYFIHETTVPPEPKCCCCCCCICCFIVLIVCVALGIVFSGGHIGLTWTNHEHSVKKILFIENNETEKTNEAVYLKDYAMKVVVPECCICVLVIIIQIAVYFAALKRDCNEDCDVCEDCDDDCCGVVVCLVVTIIVSIVKNAIESGIIFFVVRVKGKNYTDQGGNVDSGDSACCGRNNSILPICTGGDQHPQDGKKLSQRPQRGDADKHKSGEPKSNTTNSSSWRDQPPLPGIKSDKKNTRGLSANIDDSDTNPSYEKKRLTPIGQESQLGWEEKSDRSEEVKEKKKKRKSKEKEKDSNITESADL